MNEKNNSKAIDSILLLFGALLFSSALFGQEVIDFEPLPHEQVMESAEQIERLYYGGRVFDYASEFTTYLKQNGNRMAPMTYWVMLTKHFELCLWGDHACGNVAVNEAIRWFDAISEIPELDFLEDLIRIEAAQMHWYSAGTREQTAEEILSNKGLFFEAHTRLNGDVYDVDSRLASKEHIYKAYTLESAKKTTVAEIEANEKARSEHLFHALTLTLSQTTYDPDQYKSALRNLIQIIRGIANLRNYREAYFLASEIRPLIYEHFQRKSYERVNFNILFAHLTVNSLPSGETFVLESMTDTQSVIAEMQWPGENQAVIMKRAALAFTALVCGKLGDQPCLETNLRNFIKSYDENPNVWQPNIYVFRSLSEFSHFIPEDLRPRLQQIYLDSASGLIASETVDSDDIDELSLDGDLFSDSGLYKSTSSEQEIDAFGFNSLRLSFREKALDSAEKSQLMSYLIAQHPSVDDFVLIANELLVKGNFSNLAYSNVQSNLAGSKAEQDLVKDFLRLSTQRYSFLYDAVAKFKSLSSQSPRVLFGWEVDFEWIRAFSAYLRRLTDLEAQLASLNREMQDLIRVKKIQASLEPDEALLYTILRGDRISSTCITKSQSLTSSQSIDSNTFNLHARILNMSLTSSHAPSDQLDRVFPIDSAHFLHEAIFSGVAQCTRNIDHLFWIPSDNLDRISLSALITERSENAEELADERGLGELPWLAKEFSHSILKSAVELYIPQLITDSERLLAIGDPQIPRAASSEEAVASIRRGLSGANLALEDLASLPNTSTELRTIATVFPGESELMLQTFATEQNVRAALVSSPGVLTFATHGLVSGELKNLNESALLLTPGPNSENSLDDGLLTTSEIADLSINAKFISLSACNTAIYEPGLFTNQVGGLTAAFQLAGARTILGTLWPVETTSAELINSSLYAGERFQEGDFSSALNQSQKTLINGDYGIAFQHPRFWAAYNLYGLRKNTIKPEGTPPPVLRQKVTGRVSAMFKAHYADAIAVAAIQETQDSAINVYGMLDPTTLEIKDSMTGDEAFRLWAAGPVKDKFLGIGSYFGVLEDQGELWGEEWENYEGWTGYMEVYDRSIDERIGFSFPFLITGTGGTAHISSEGIGTMIYPTLGGAMNIFAAWNPAEGSFALSEIPHHEEQFGLQMHTSGNASYIGVTILHQDMQSPSQKLQPNGTTAFCGYLYTTHLYRVDLDFEPGNRSVAALITSIPNFNTTAIGERDGKLYLGGSVKKDCVYELNAAVLELHDGERNTIYASSKPASAIQVLSTRDEEFILVESYQSDSGISDLDLPTNYGAVSQNKIGIPISWEKFRRQRSRVVVLDSSLDAEVVATISSGGDSLVTALERTDDAIYVAGSSAGTPFIRKIPRAEQSLQH